MLDPNRPFTMALKRQRERLNARFAHARRQRLRLEASHFYTFLENTLGPAIDAVAAVSPGSEDRTLDALSELALELFSRSLLGPESREPMVQKTWDMLLIPAAHLLAQHARALIGSFTNAVYTLSQEEAEGMEAWILHMARLLPACPELSQALALGRVLAWRHGASARRAQALQALEHLSAPLFQKALELPDGWEDPLRPALLERMRLDPWSLPGRLAEGLLISPTAPIPRELCMAGSVGAFRGFGGPLRRPAKVTVSDSAFIVDDSGELYLLEADCFGQGLRRLPASFPLGPVGAYPQLSLAQDGTVSAATPTGTISRRFPLLAEARTWAATAHTLAVTLPFSHRIYLVVVQEARRP